MSREHRRAKTDRLDTELLKRGFLGWLRGERGHCSMVRVPTIAEEDAKRPNRERECLVKDRTRLVNRMKGTLARLGIRNFRPSLRNAAEPADRTCSAKELDLRLTKPEEIRAGAAEIGPLIAKCISAAKRDPTHKLPY